MSDFLSSGNVAAYSVRNSFNLSRFEEVGAHTPPRDASVAFIFLLVKLLPLLLLLLLLLLLSLSLLLLLLFSLLVALMLRLMDL